MSELIKSPHVSAQVELFFTAESGRHWPIFSGYREQFHLHGGDDVAVVEWYFPDVERLAPGESGYSQIWFARPERHLPQIHVGDAFEIREGAKVVGRGNIIAFLEAN